LKKLFAIFLHVAVVAVLTMTTQIGGLIYLLTLLIQSRFKLRKAVGAVVFFWTALNVFIDFGTPISSEVR
jgi:uncharacterized membrane protein